MAAFPHEGRSPAPEDADLDITQRVFSQSPPRLPKLRELSLPTRFAIAAFLVSVGIGYFSALVQLHFQHASPGKMLPDGEDAVQVFHGKQKMSQLEKLLVADEGKPFNGSGTMRNTFTSRSAGWTGAINKRSKQKNLTLAKAEAELRGERDGERVALIAWITAGADKTAYENNLFQMPKALEKVNITEEFVERDEADGSVKVKIASILEKRCSRCHAEGVGGSAAQFPLDNWEQVHEYCEVQTATSAISIQKLAQTTHIHLLGFAMLYGLTGVIFSFSSYPTWVRAVLSPWPLLIQVADISFWWLARLDPIFAYAIVVSGSLVALGVFLQITLSLANMFGKTGKAMLLVAMVVGALGGYVVKTQYIDPFLARERTEISFTE